MERGLLLILIEPAALPPPKIKAAADQKSKIAPLLRVTIRRGAELERIKSQPIDYKRFVELRAPTISAGYWA